MANDQSWTNDFIAGMRSDSDPASQEKSTYRQSLNGRVFFNQVTGSLSWQTVYGNKQVIDFKGNYGQTKGYTPIGQAEFPNCIALLSTYNGNSEIGMVTVDVTGTWSYQTCYNDLYDPNGGLLKFSLAHDMQSVIPNVENEQTWRIYYTDYFNQSRVFNLQEGNKNFNPDFIAQGSYLPIGGATIGNVYPPYYSAFSMDNTPQFSMGQIKFVQTISGNKLSGVYQYIYRLLTKDGYETPWTMPTRPLFLTTDVIDPTNSQEYAMQASNIATNKGIQIEIDGIDIRYNQIQVAYIFSIVPSQSISAAYFSTIDIDGQTSIVVNDIDNGGTPIALTSISAQFSNIQLVKAMAVREKYLLKGGITTQTPPIIDGSQITCIPHVRSMHMDEQVQSATTAAQNIPMNFTSTYNNSPLIDAYFTSMSAYYLGGTTTPVYNKFQINKDYINYQGMQVDSLYSGYFREEWYRFGILLFDLAGNPWYVTHVCDIQLPPQTGNQFTTIQIDNAGNVTTTTATHGSAADYLLTFSSISTPIEDFSVTDINPRLQILGMMFGNIDLTDVIDQISAFAIVRVERDPTILAQGLILPMVCESGGSDNNKVRGMGYPSNNFITPAHATPLWQPNGVAMQAKTSAYNYVMQQSYFAYSCPDYIFDNTVLPTLNESHNIKLVGGVHNGIASSGAYYSPVYGIIDFGSDGTTSGDRRGFIDKTYYTAASGVFQDYLSNYINFSDSKWQSGMRTWAPFGFDTTQSGFDPSNGSLTLDGFTHNGTTSGIPGISTGHLYDGGYHQNAICISVNGVTPTPLYPIAMTYNTGTLNEVTYGLANYIITGKTPYGGVNPTSISQSIFYSTGHFQPITEQVKSEVLHSGRYVFNNVEVFGGDCYNDLYALARVYAQDDNSGSSTGGYSGGTNSVAIGNAFPCEMKYNSFMRNGNTWAKSGFVAPAPYFPAGVSKYNFEAQTINDVLTYEETNVLYTGKPINLSFISDFSQRWYYSVQKIDGEVIDSWRQFPVNQFDDCEGVYGRVMGAFTLGDGLVYCLQEKGFSRIRFTDRSSLSQTQTDTLKIGIGAILDSFEYISTVFGTQHSLSIANTGKSVYWVDADHQCICRFSQNGFENLSDQHGVHNLLLSYFKNPNGITPQYDYSFDNPTLNGGIHAVVDRVNREILFTFINNPSAGAPSLPTLGFNEANDAFSSQYSFIPSKYMQLNENLISFDYAAGGNATYGLFLHNLPTANIAQFYGVNYNSLLTFVATAKNVKFYQVTSEDSAKIWQVCEMFCNENVLPLLSNVSIVTDYTTDSLQPNSDSRARNREGHLWFPYRGFSTPYRTRGAYLIVGLTLANTGTQTVALIRSVESSYRLSHK